MMDFPKQICDTVSNVQMYQCAKIIKEDHVVAPWPDMPDLKFNFTVCVDKCLINEIKWLWSKGIHTTGCCCGRHLEDPEDGSLAYIGVCPKSIEKIKALGYRVAPNPCRPGAEDSFIPKTRII